MRPDMPAEDPQPGFVWVYNIMTRTWIQQAQETPWFCRVDSESYWSQ